MRKIFLENLPKSNHNGGSINWKESINCKIRFIYDDIEGDLTIIDYRSKEQTLTVEYKKDIFKIRTGNLKKLKLGNILSKKQQRLIKDFKIEIGNRFQDDKRNITIIDRENRIKRYEYQTYNKKYYKYKCNKDGYEGWIEENRLLNGGGCGCCHNPKPILSINTIWDTDPWMIPYIGEGCAKTHTHGSNDKVEVICPDCGKVKDKKLMINNIYRNHTIYCSCGDGQPYPEKFMFNVLEQLGIDFKTQLSKITFSWCGKYKYDFYFELNGEQVIVETHGRQHYEESWNFQSNKTTRSYEEEQENDKIKKELALSNGIKEENYIVIDCRKSDFKFIKDRILNNEKIINRFDLSKIDWLKCEQFALSNRVKEACELWNSGIHSTPKIGEIMKLCQPTICRYLTKGSKIWNWVNYNAQEARNKGLQIGRENKRKPIVCINNKMIFQSVSELERCSEELFGIKLHQGCISAVCNGKQKAHKGFEFKYIKALTKEEYIKYDIENKLKKLHNQELVQAC